MNYWKLGKTFKMLKLLLFTLATSLVSYGQETNDQEIDQLLDELFFNDAQLVDDLMNAINEYNFIYASTTYSSNTFFAGRDSGVDQLNIAPQVSYFNSSGFNAAISSVYLEQQNPQWDFVSLTAGYGNTIGKKKNFHYNASYSRFFFSDGFDDFNNSIDAFIGVRNQQRSFGVVFSASYLFGTEQSVQLSSRVYGNFRIFGGRNHAFKFRPQLNFLVAEQAISFLRRPRPGQPLPVLVTINEFQLLNTQLNLPISFTTSTWDIDLGWNLNIPNAIKGEGNLDSTSFVSLTVGYLFDLGN